MVTKAERMKLYQRVNKIQKYLNAVTRYSRTMTWIVGIGKVTKILQILIEIPTTTTYEELDLEVKDLEKYGRSPN